SRRLHALLRGQSRSCWRWSRAHTSRRRGTSAVIASAASCNNKAHARHGRAGAQIPSTRPTEYRQHRLLARTFGMGVAKLLDVAIVFGKRARKGMPAVSVGDEIEVVARRRMQRRA